MSLSMHHIVTTTTTQLLSGLFGVLDHAEGLVTDGKITEADMMEARFAPDMFEFRMQIWRACDHGRAAARLAGLETPVWEQGDLTFASARELVQETLDLIASVTEPQLDGSDEREVEIIARQKPTRFKGKDYLLRIAIPQVAFHVTTAYDLVRNAGADIGKRHYLGTAFDYVIE